MNVDALIDLNSEVLYALTRSDNIADLKDFSEKNIGPKVEKMLQDSSTDKPICVLLYYLKELMKYPKKNDFINVAYLCNGMTSSLPIEIGGIQYV